MVKLDLEQTTEKNNVKPKYMLINPFPHIIYKDKEPYKLYLSYNPNHEGEFEWILTYVGPCGILYRDTSMSTDVLLKNFDVYCNKNQIVK